MKRNSAAGILAVYADLIKYKLSLAVTFSSVAGYFIFRDIIEINLLFLVIGVFCLASGAAVLNQTVEVKFDALMERTRQRPLPMEKLSSGRAVVFAFSLFFCGSFFLSFTGLIPVLLGIFNIFLYIVIYTKLKRITQLAIIPGSLVGAVPPLIGFCAAGGIVTDMRIVLLSGFMFCWQIPHFWLILLKYHKEYEKAGFVTIFHLIDESQIKMLVFVWVLFSTTILSFFSGSGILFDRKISSILVPLNLLFISSFYYLLFRKCNKAEFRGAFILFNVFSLIILVLFIVNSFVSEI